MRILMKMSKEKGSNFKRKIKYTDDKRYGVCCNLPVTTVINRGLSFSSSQGKNYYSLVSTKNSIEFGLSVNFLYSKDAKNTKRESDYTQMRVETFSKCISSIYN